MIGRGAFLWQGAAGVAGLLVPIARPNIAQAGGAADSRIEVLLDEPIGTINPNIYGHFIENLGGVIYDGVWVGRHSNIANVDGIRKALIDEMRKIMAPVIRYPGGCFADSYDWRDGVGPVNSRPRRTNFWADSLPADAPMEQKYDQNAFGTNEFLHFCDLAGSRPYLAANVRSLPAEQFDRWVEYCNSPPGSTTLADSRAASGHPEPFGVRLWGVGNEAWGCGGSFTAEEYAEEFCRYIAAVPTYGQELSFIASGPDKDDWNWTRGFFEEILKRGPGQLGSIYGFALHSYTWNLSRGKTRDWIKGKGDAIGFNALDWYELLRQGDRMESLIDGHWQIMETSDPTHVVKLVVDEWAPWYRPGSSLTSENLFEQTPTLRDAVFSAMMLDVFNRNCDKVVMANCAQLVNCLNSLYLAHEDKFCVTPVGHVFAMYAPHQRGKSLRAVFSAPSVIYDRDGQTASFWGLQGSASLLGKTLTLTVVNPHITEPRQAHISIRNATVVSGTATTLSHADMHAHNTFKYPSVVAPMRSEIRTLSPTVEQTFPPASVTTMTMLLG